MRTRPMDRARVNRRATLNRLIPNSLAISILDLPSMKYRRATAAVRTSEAGPATRSIVIDPLRCSHEHDRAHFAYGLLTFGVTHTTMRACEIVDAHMSAPGYDPHLGGRGGST